MSKLVNMKIDPKEREKRYAEPTVAGDAPMYPWGLQLNLDDEVMEKLGLEELPAADTEVLIVARATVTSSSINESKAGKRQSMTLQITDLAVASPDEKKTDDKVLFKA